MALTLVAAACVLALMVVAIAIRLRRRALPRWLYFSVFTISASFLVPAYLRIWDLYQDRGFGYLVDCLLQHSSVPLRDQMLVLVGLYVIVMGALIAIVVLVAVLRRRYASRTAL